MKDFTKIALLVCVSSFTLSLATSASAQERDRVVKSTSSRPTNAPMTTEQIRTSTSRPILTNEIKVVRPDQAWEPAVQKTASVKAVNVPSGLAAGKTAYSMANSMVLDRAIKERYGIPYRYGSTGPNTYDCSGFVWSSFQEAGINFTRASAASLWNQSEIVDGDDRYKFGTLVFLNGLGHIGIVADANGFYHASSSKGITYSPFKGYWESRIVGFRRLKPESITSDPK